MFGLQSPNTDFTSYTLAFIGRQTGKVAILERI
jgi:hypothetical protein